jgi:hypothetical protein
MSQVSREKLFDNPTSLESGNLVGNIMIHLLEIEDASIVIVLDHMSNIRGSKLLAYLTREEGTVMLSSMGISKGTKVL